MHSSWIVAASIVCCSTYFIVRAIEFGSSAIVAAIRDFHHVAVLVADEHKERMPVDPDAIAEAVGRVEDRLEDMQRVQRGQA